MRSRIWVAAIGATAITFIMTHGILASPAPVARGQATSDMRTQSAREYRLVSWGGQKLPAEDYADSVTRGRARVACRLMMHDAVARVRDSSWFFHDSTTIECLDGSKTNTSQRSRGFIKRRGSAVYWWIDKPGTSGEAFQAWTFGDTLYLNVMPAPRDGWALVRVRDRSPSHH